jgi:AcrR family transcriptional regulator
MGRPKLFNREGVLEKALPVFWRRGFADASLHELEVATGVNKSGLYSEFKDKEDLFMQSLQYYLESLEKKGLLTAEPLGWNNIERLLKMGPCRMEGQPEFEPTLHRPQNRRSDEHSLDTVTNHCGGVYLAFRWESGR